MPTPQTQIIETSKVSNFVFSQLFKNFKSPNVDLFIFDNASLTLDPGSTTTSTFAGDLQMTGFLSPFQSLLDSSDALAVTAKIETALGLSKKIAPQKLSLLSIVPFHIPLFKGVTLMKATLQVTMEKKGAKWTFTPSVEGTLDVDGITDVDETKIKFHVLLEEDTLKLSAEGKNLNGAFGLTQLMLDEISIKGTIGKEKQLSISSNFEVGTTHFSFDGLITPNAVGMIASAENFTLNELANLFIEVSPGNLKLPDFDVDFKNTSIAFASEDCTIGDRDLEKGLSLATELTAHDHTISASADITPDGVAFSGTIGNLEIGPVDIKKAGLDFQIYKRSSGKSSLFTIYGEAKIQKCTGRRRCLF